MYTTATRLKLTGLRPGWLLAHSMKPTPCSQKCIKIWFFTKIFGSMGGKVFSEIDCEIKLMRHRKNLKNLCVFTLALTAANEFSGKTGLFL